MRAVGSSHPGLDGFSVVEVPQLPLGPGQVRVGVEYSALNPADLKVAQGQFVARFIHAKVTPWIPGWDFCGTVLERGDGVTSLNVGDVVFGHLPYASSARQGACADNVVVGQDEVARVPAGMDHALAAAAATGGLTALQFLRDLGGLKSGQRLLVIGAAGAVGSASVSVGKRLGAHVTGVCSAVAVERVAQMGADVVVDRGQQDPFASGGPYDVVFDTTSTYPFGRVKKVLGPKGVLVLTLPGPVFLLGKLQSLLGSQRVAFGGVKSIKTDLETLAGFLLQGMQVPVAKTVAVKDVGQGLAAMASGKLLGKVVIQVKDGLG